MQQADRQKKGIVAAFLKSGILLSPDAADEAFNAGFESLASIINGNKQGLLVLSRDIMLNFVNARDKDINWLELEKSRAAAEKGNDKGYTGFLGYLNTGSQQGRELPSGCGSRVSIVRSYKDEPKKREVQDFVGHYNIRYRAIENILKNRSEMKNVISLSRLRNKKERERISIIGMVLDKQVTKNKNLMITLEDPTDTVRAVVSKTKEAAYATAQSLVCDEVIGLTGTNSEKIVFADSIYLPDVPATKEIKKSPEEGYAVFLSDLHVGSKNFLEDDFARFIKWSRQEAGSEKQKEIASKLKYLFIAGDLIDGCGIYPSQEEELSIKEITLQYAECARLLKQIPANVQIILCPGNHDALRISEPQPELCREFADSIYKLPNVTVVSNPAIVNVDSSGAFPGFDVLLYHGYSFDFFISEVDSIRNNGGYDRGDLVMKFLLQRRHLAPTHTSTLYIPDPEKDALALDKLPDFFLSGHIHKSVVSSYRNITLVCGSCWQSKTKFQEKVGHNPEPGRAPIVNLKTREMKILKFSK